MNTRRISLKDIASELNLSISTVSRALRNTGEMSRETRDKVINYARKMNYRPNPLAMSLLRGKTNVIGVVMPEIQNQYYSTILNGIYQVACDFGYRLFTVYTDDSAEKEKKVIDELIASQVDGLLICPAADTIDYIPYIQLREEKVPLVFFERTIPDLPVPGVSTDNFNSIVNVVDYLVSTKCKHIALIASFEPLSVGRIRYEGYIHALKKHGIAFNRDFVIHGDLGLTTSIEAARNLLNMETKPDAIIGNNDTVAMATIKVIKEYNLRIPEDISVVGFNDEPFSSFLDPSLTTVSQPAYLIGMKAMEMMLQMLQDDTDRNIKPFLLESGLVIRQSTREMIVP